MDSYISCNIYFHGGFTTSVTGTQEIDVVVNYVVPNRYDMNL